MNPLDPPIHAILLVADAACLLAVYRWRWLLTPATLLCGSIGLYAAADYGFAAGGNIFAGMRGMAWTLFFHGPMVLLAGAYIARERREAIGHALVGVALVLVAIDAFVIEPRWLDVEHHTIHSAEVDERLRIVVLADIQTDDVGAWEEAAFRRAMEEKPDLIVLPGDFLQVDIAQERYPAQVEKMRALWPILQAPLGVWAVQGNVDWRETWAQDLFEGTHIEAAQRTRTKRTGGVALTSVSFLDGHDIGLKLPGERGFHIAFAHLPDFALSDQVGADLLIAGHTHGGQVVLPFLGPPITLSKVPRAWGRGGLNEVAEGRHLVVSRGVGLERGHAPRLRFMCRPQIVVVDVLPK